MTAYNEQYLENDEYNEQIKKEEAYIRAKKRLDNIIGFYWHLVVFVVINALIMIIITS